MCRFLSSRKDNSKGLGLLPRRTLTDSVSNLAILLQRFLKMPFYMDDINPVPQMFLEPLLSFYRFTH